MSPSVIFDRRGPLVIALALLAVGLALVVRQVEQQADGRFVYALDDTYIHLAIAKNLTLHGNWGVSPTEFSTAASSLAWPLAVSGAFLLCGVREWVPLAFNAIAAALAVLVAWSILERRKPPYWLMLVMLGILILATPMIPLVAVGMEHLAQAVVSLVFLYAACSGMEDRDQRWWGLRATTVALLSAPLVTAIRYEGMFLIVAVSMLELLHGQWRRALITAALGMLPVVVAGAVFVSHGAFFFPASVLIKSSPSDLGSVAGVAHLLPGAIEKLIRYPELAALILAVAVVTAALGRRGWHAAAGLMGIAFLAVAAMHVLFAQVGWFYRYEAYLVYVGLVVIMLEVGELFSSRPAEARSWRPALVLAGLCLAWPIGTRVIHSHSVTVRGCLNIYRQQIQMARFLDEFYPGASIAISDIGAICFFTDARCLDLRGLGDTEIARLRLEHQYSRSNLERIVRSRRVEIAVTYENLLKSGLPRSWTKVGAWRMPDNVICESDTVVFYAVGDGTAVPLSEHLEEFDKRLPAVVKSAIFRPAEPDR